MMSLLSSSAAHAKGVKRKLAMPTAHMQDAEANKAKMSEALKLCAELLFDLRSRKYSEFAWPFYRPVDAKLLCLHEYHSVIRQPMNLGTIRYKMDNGEYSCARDFAADVRLMFDNCYKFYAKDHDIVQLAQHLQDLFEKRFAKIPYTGMRPPLPLAELGGSQPAAATANELAPLSSGSENGSYRDKLGSLAATWASMEVDLARLLEARQRHCKASQGVGAFAASPAELPAAAAQASSSAASDVGDTNWQATNAYSAFAMQPGGPQTAQQLQSALASCSFRTRTCSLRGRGTRGGRGRGSRGPYMKRYRPGFAGRGNYQGLSYKQDDSEEEANAEPLTPGELRKLLNKINRLTTEKLVELVNIIEEREPNVKQDTGKKFEIDFKLLKDSTIRRVQRFVAQSLPKKTYNKKAKMQNESQPNDAASGSSAHTAAYAPMAADSSPTALPSTSAGSYGNGMLMQQGVVNLSASSSDTTTTSDSSSEDDSTTTDTSDVSDGRDAN